METAVLDIGEQKYLILRLCVCLCYLCGCVKEGVFSPLMDRRGAACDIYFENGQNVLFPLYLILISEVYTRRKCCFRHMSTGKLFYILLDQTQSNRT